MPILPDQAKNCLKKFVEWGGFAGCVSYLLNGEITRALLTALIFGILVVLSEKYFNKLP